MNRFIILAATAALAACGSNNDNAAVTDDTAVAPTTATTTASNPDAAGVAGTYEMTQADGTVVRQQLNADGTYVKMGSNGAETERGTWRTQGEALCLDDAGSAAEVCTTGSEIGADGTFRMIGADGRENGTVVRKIG